MTEPGPSQLKSTLRADLHTSMREHDKVRSSTLRMALTAVTNEEVSGTTARELSDDEVLKVLAREAKKRREAATAYREAKRPELAAKEEAELVFLEAYLPAQLSDPELQALVAQAINETGANGMPQMGMVMKAATTLVAGRAEGGRVAAIVKSALAAR
ncbi:MAG TPA: GatB/YqeY domain-containing protein [Dermatophilaceae bacterium]